MQGSSAYLSILSIQTFNNVMRIKNQFLIVLGIFFLTSCRKGDDPGVSTIATSAQFCKSTLSLVTGGREKLLLIVDPVNASITGASWSSSDTRIATVDDQGIVTALATGETTITVTVGSSIKEHCTAKIIASPIKDLVLPKVQYPIAKDALLFIQGESFKTGDKIRLRKINTSASSLKSAQTDDDIIAQIHEQAANYISFYCSVTPAWYSIILEEDNSQFNLGNVNVVTPNIPEYAYDKNKIIWEDTHWRRFQLRGKVKKMNTIEETPYWASKYTYTFNEKGYLNTAGVTGNKGIATYEYDSFNRITKKSDDCNIIGSGGTIDHLSCEYSYGSHNLYVPLNFESKIAFSPNWYSLFYFGGPVSYNERYDLGMCQKGLVSIKLEKHYTMGKTETTNYQLTVSSNKVTTSYSGTLFDTNTNYTWEYNANMPNKETRIYTSSNGSQTIGINIFNFSTNGIPISQESIYNKISSPLKYVENSPFPLYASYDDSKGSGQVFNCEYDKNWDLIKFNEGSKVIFNYNSYDDFGNWTQCIALAKDKYGSVLGIHRLTREISYW